MSDDDKQFDKEFGLDMPMDEALQRFARVTKEEIAEMAEKGGVTEGEQYAHLTNIISERTFGMHTQTHKKLKGLKAQNLRDHMTDLELVLTMLGETSTKEIAQQKDAQGFYENSQAANAGGAIAGGARKQIEQQTGRRVASSQNFLGADKREADPHLLTRK